MSQRSPGVTSVKTGGEIPYAEWNGVKIIVIGPLDSEFRMAAGDSDPGISRRGGWGKLAGGVKWPPPPVRHLTKVNEMTVVSGHLSSLEVTRSKISKSCPL